MRYWIMLEGTSGILIDQEDYDDVESALFSGRRAIKVTNFDNDDEVEVLVNLDNILFVRPIS